MLGKTRLILESFSLADDSLSLTEIASRTGIAKASVHRLNRELLTWGMLERSGQEYRLGMRAFELGSRVPRFRVLRDAARPYMEALHQRTKETVHLAVLDGAEVLYLEKVSGGPKATRQSSIAGRMPLHSTATGKVLLAFGPPELQQEVATLRPLQRVTPATIVMPGMLLDQLRRVRAEGVATEFEETTAGYCSVAVPIFGMSGLVLASLALTVPVVRANVQGHTAALKAVSRSVTKDQAIK